MHHLPTQPSLFGIVLLAAALFFVGAAALPAQPVPHPAAIADQVTPELAGTPTPMPTLANLDGSGGSPGNIVLVGLMLVCVMGLMLVAGVGIAVLIVRIRTKSGR